MLFGAEYNRMLKNPQTSWTVHAYTDTYTHNYFHMFCKNKWAKLDLNELFELFGKYFAWHI